MAQQEFTEIPVQIVGLQKDDIESSKAEVKFQRSLQALGHIHRDIIEASVVVKTSALEKDRKRYEVQVFIKPPKEQFDFTEEGWSIEEVFERIGEKIKRLMTKPRDKPSHRRHPSRIEMESSRFAELSLKEQAPKGRINLTRFYPPRPGDSRKGGYGRVVIAGGSDQYAGCLAFNALPALRAGADLSIIIAPRRAADIVAGYSPDLITAQCSTPFPDPEVAREFLTRADSLIIGCGITRTRAAHGALLSIIKNCKVPIVTDAESLHALASRPNAGNGKRMLLTPNV